MVLIALLYAAVRRYLNSGLKFPFHSHFQVFSSEISLEIFIPLLLFFLLPSFSCFSVYCNYTPSQPIPDYIKVVKLLLDSDSSSCFFFLISDKGYYTFLYGHKTYNREVGIKNNEHTWTWVSSKKGVLWHFAFSVHL